MSVVARVPELMTVEQAARYLQVSPVTIHRYVRDGKLLATKLGRSYRIPKRNIDLLILAGRTRPDITLRDYTREEVAEFLRLDELDEATNGAVRQIDAALTEQQR